MSNDQFDINVSSDSLPPEVPPLSHNDAEYSCQVCGLELFYSGRGRHPKFCDEHKPGAANNRAPKAAGNMTALRSSLIEMYMFVGMGVTIIDPMDGMTITGSAEKLADSWITLANSNPKVKKFLFKVTTGGGVGAVIIAHLMVMVPILANHDMLPTFMSKDRVAN